MDEAALDAIEARAIVDANTERPRLKLYEIPEAFEQISLALHESFGELTPEIEQMIEAAEGDLEFKAENIGRLIQEKTRLHEARKKLGEELVESAARFETAAMWLKWYLGYNLKESGNPNLQTPSFAFMVHEDANGKAVASQVAKVQPEPPRPPTTLEKDVAALVTTVRAREALRDARKAERNRLDDLAKGDDEAQQAAKDAILKLMKEVHDIKKIETDGHTVRWQRNSAPSISVLLPEDAGVVANPGDYVPDELLVYPEAPPPTVNKELIRVQWKAAGQMDKWTAWVGDEIELADIVDTTKFTPKIEVTLGYHVRIA